MSNIISFPGLGIEGFTLDPVAFSIFGFEIRWYGIIITLAMVAGFFVALNRAKIEQIKTDDVLDLAIFLIIFAMVGARLYYVLNKLEDYNSFWDVINVRNGGLAIFGGVGAGAITVYVVARVKKIAAAKMYDMVVPGLMIGQAIGRWGNFTNAEAHGTQTKLPWRMGIQKMLSDKTYYYHPTFLYESLWNLIGFGIVMGFYRKKKFDGFWVFFYMIWYGIGRFFIEGLRTDSLYLLKTQLGETIRISQVVGFVIFVLGIIFMVMGFVKLRNDKLAEGEYERVYSSDRDAILGVGRAEEEKENFEILASEEEAEAETNNNAEPSEPATQEESEKNLP